MALTVAKGKPEKTLIECHCLLQAVLVRDDRFFGGLQEVRKGPVSNGLLRSSVAFPCMLLASTKYSGFIRIPK